MQREEQLQPQLPQASSEEQYLNLVRWVRKSDAYRPDRTNTGTQARLGGQLRFNLAEGFPLLTTKKVHLKSIIHELLWFVAGDTNNNTLKDKGVKIWNDWAVQQTVERQLSDSERHQRLLAKLNEDGYLNYVVCPGELSFELQDLYEQKKWRVYREDLSYEQLLEKEGIPHVVVERGPKDGELGPVYGAQWRRWKATREVKHSRPLKLSEALLEALRQKRNDLAACLFGLTHTEGVDAPVAALEAKYPTIKLEAQLEGLGLQRTVEETRLETYEIDQLAELIENLRKKPFSRRHVITAWNPADLPDESKPPHVNAAEGKMALAACHCMFQFYVDYRSEAELRAEISDELWAEAKDYVRNLPEYQQGQISSFVQLEHDPSVYRAFIQANEQLMRFLESRGVRTKRLSCHLYQRSADLMVGVPFNIPSYALLTMMIAQVVGMVPGEYVHSFGDAHVYVPHFANAEIQLGREPLPWPKMHINPQVKNIDDFKFEDFTLQDYQSHSALVYEIAV